MAVLTATVREVELAQGMVEMTESLLVAKKEPKRVPM